MLHMNAYVQLLLTQPGGQALATTVDDAISWADAVVLATPGETSPLVTPYRPTMTALVDQRLPNQRP